MKFFNKLSLKYKISGLVLLCNAFLVFGSMLGLQKLSFTDGALTHYYLIFATVSLLASGLSVLIGFKIAKSVEAITKELAQNTLNLDEVAEKIATGSTELSSAATEQAAALQESVATIDQIGAMIRKNSEAAQKSKELSVKSKDSAERGREIVDVMLTAMDEIEINNNDLSQQTRDSNNQLTEITKLIHEISTKTQVINDIVFQTKLLSFNAAVEAARAGEYGYGFAVVADEIGKLAQRSGAAAKEITKMLQDSVDRVEFIIKDTKTKVDKTMVASKQKISFGTEKAKLCQDALNEIFTNVACVDTLVLEITEASKEQSLGVEQFANAMNQLESVTDQNSSVAQSSSAAGVQLRQQSTTINGIVKNLNGYINGSHDLAHDQYAPLATAGAPVKPDKGDKKVLKFKKPVAEPVAHEPMVYKKAAGYEGKAPSADDPGFNE